MSMYSETERWSVRNCPLGGAPLISNLWAKNSTGVRSGRETPRRRGSGLRSGENRKNGLRSPRCEEQEGRTKRFTSVISIRLRAPASGLTPVLTGYALLVRIESPHSIYVLLYLFASQSSTLMRPSSKKSLHFPAPRSENDLIAHERWCVPLTHVTHRCQSGR